MFSTFMSETIHFCFTQNLQLDELQLCVIKSQEAFTLCPSNTCSQRFDKTFLLKLNSSDTVREETDSGCGPDLSPSLPFNYYNAEQMCEKTVLDRDLPEDPDLY